MASLIDKIEADAAQRLSLPPGRQPSQEIARYKNFLKLESARLLMLHRAGGGGREVCRGRAMVLDALLRHILDDIVKGLNVPQPPRFALVAIGGYGRGELNPQSDIDIMFLHAAELVSRGKASPGIAAITDGLLYPLWDAGLKVGHAVRSVDDCVNVANGDMQSKTSLIEARLVSGDSKLFEQMQSAVLAKCVRGHDQEYIEARLLDQTARRTKYGNSACMQEPNIKNGCGGLRDYQSLMWMAYFKERVQSMEQLQERGMVTETERKQLDTAYDFLLRVRTDLHYRTRRAVDALPKSLQPAIAHDFGYTDRSPSKRLEAFMRELYKHMRNVYLITRTIEQRLALPPPPGRIPSLRALLFPGRRTAEQFVDGFKIARGQIHAGTPRVFRDQPRRLMRVFLHAQHFGAALHPDLAQMIRHELRLMDREVLRDPHVRESFLEILNLRGSVAPILRAMHEVGLLGKYLPEFGKLTCLVQHEFYHQYTADEHTLYCIEKLDQISAAKEPPLAAYAQLFHNVEQPFLLYLALLLHDAGKALAGGNHYEAGGHIAHTVAKRLNLDGATAHSLRLIIENHLTMVQISQRRDLDDPAVIATFAAQIQSQENLILLTLHTLADSQGTSDKLWNGFKDSLLWTLYHKTLAVLSGGTDFVRAEERQIELLREETQGLLPPTFSPDEIQAHFEHLPARYFRIHSAKQIAADIVFAHRFMHLQVAEEDKALEPVINWHNEPDRGYTSVHVCTWDRAGLFRKIAGSLAAAGLNILSAQIFTRSDGIILDTFFVTDSSSGLVAKKEEKEKLEKMLRESLVGEVDFSKLIVLHKIAPSLYKSLEGEPIPTAIRFDNEISKEWTVLEIEAEDRMGFLYTVSQALAELDLDISLAKIVTENGAAIDSFYVLDSTGSKIADPGFQAYIEKQIRHAIGKLASSGS